MSREVRHGTARPDAPASSDSAAATPTSAVTPAADGTGPDHADAPAPAVRSSRAARMADRLHERRARHIERSRPYRVAVVLLGFLVVIVGLLLTAPGVPGPGFLVILIGLALLALEFTWAERLLRRSLGYLERAGDFTSGQSTRRKVVAAIVCVAAIGLGVAAVIAFDVPIPFLR